MLEELSMSQLKAVIERAEELRSERSSSERTAFLEDVKTRAAALGLSVQDLFGGSATPRRGRQAGQTKAIGRAQPTPPDKRRASPPVKYRGPNKEEWTGRGRPPRWLSALEAEGRKREDFRV